MKWIFLQLASWGPYGWIRKGAPWSPVTLTKDLNVIPTLFLNESVQKHFNIMVVKTVVPTVWLAEKLEMWILMKTK